jgi:acetyl esterase/lipase
MPTASVPPGARGNFHHFTQETPMKSWSRLWILIVLLLAVSVSDAFAYEVAIRRNIEYAEHDGVKLHGDLYHPVTRERSRLPIVPVVIAVHGGGWRSGGPDTYKQWGPYLAEAGFAVFAIEYRLSKPGQKTYPAAVYDVGAAVQFVRAQASSLAIDPDRIALMGDGAGAHLAALVTLANAEPAFSSQYKNDPNASTPATVKAAAVFYGIYNLTAQWEHDQVAQPLDQVTGQFLGATPMASRQLYFEASPISYATVDRNKPQFLIIYGTSDEVVDVNSQSLAFQTALRQAQFFAHKIEVPSVGHYWVPDPFSDPDSPNSYVGPQLLRFLERVFGVPPS